MALNFPIGPTVGQQYYYNGKYFEWNGTVWIQKNTTTERSIAEYKNFYNVPQSSSVTLDVRKFNAFKVTVDANTTITVPTAQPYTKFLLELDYGIDVVNWDLANASYDNISFSVVAQDTSPSGLAFRPDGTKMYVVGDGTDTLYQYTLSIPWSISSASYDSISFNISSQSGAPFGVTFKPDGTKMYLAGYTTNQLYQYTLSTPWDLSTASYDSISFNTSSQSFFPLDVSFRPDGTKMYVLGLANGTVHQYSLSTPWSISSASYDSVSFSVGAQDGIPIGISFKPDGTKMYMVGVSNDTVHQYSLSTPWNISSASYDSVSFSVAAQEVSPYGITFRPDGTKMYVVGNVSDTVHQYTTSDTAPTITWSDNVRFPNNITLPQNLSTSLFEFTTFDGRTWIPEQLVNVLE